MIVIQVVHVLSQAWKGILKKVFITISGQTFKIHENYLSSSNIMYYQQNFAWIREKQHLAPGV